MSTKENLQIHLHTSQNGQNVPTTTSATSLSPSPLSNSPISNETNTSMVSISPTHSETSIGIQLGMEKASQLIIGYLRTQRLKFSNEKYNNNNCNCNSIELICGKHTNIPTAIISIITYFYPKMNGKLFCWHIDNPNIIKNFINAKHKQRFASDIFEMKNLKWYLSAYPNGDRKEGSCTVYLTLISFPSIWSKFICNYSIYCNQTRSSATYITTYTEKRSQSGRIAGLLSINEIKNKYNNKQLNSITFSVNVNILQIYDKNNIIYQYKLLGGSNIKNKYIIIWNINKFMVNEFLHSDAIKQYETDVYYDMFCLAFCPNGGWRENAGQARLSLKLCCLPSEISKIKVKMELLCVETETYYSDICDFGYDSKNTVRAWPTDMLLTPQLNGLNKLTFKCMIFIIAKYDINGNEIIDIKKNKNDTFEKIVSVNRHRNISDVHGDIDGVHPSQIGNLSIDTSAIDRSGSIGSCDIQSQMKQMMGVLDGLKNEINDIKNMLLDRDVLKNGNDMKLCEDTKDNNIVSDGIDKKEQVKYWINNIVCMKEYYEVFIENGIDDIDIVKDLSMNELCEIGIKKLGDRKKIMNEIYKLKNIKISSIFWKLYSPNKN